MLQGVFGGSAQERGVDDEIDLRLIAIASAGYTGSGDEAEEDETIDNLDVSEDELEDTLLRIRTEMRAPAMTRSRAALPARGQRQPAGASEDQQMLDRLQRRLRSERRALRAARATGSVPAALDAVCAASDTARAIGGVAASAALGGAGPRQARPATQQRTPQVHALVDSGCNQHRLLKDLSLFVTLDRKRTMQLAFYCCV